MHLFPVTRAQFSQCEALQPNYGTACEAVQKVAPHIRHNTLFEERFMTGVLPSEVETFTHWLSEDQPHPFQIPSSDEWPSLFTSLVDEGVDELTLLDQCDHEEVRSLIHDVIAERSPLTFSELSLKNGGVVEWVTKEGLWRGRGQPRFEFSRTSFGNPDKREIIPVDGYRHRRSFLFGFRLIQSY